jgi:tRNA A-37 threonylcarbamoyl transferase component Bud32
MPDLTGRTLGRYQIIERMGRGGMADVYRAYHPGLDRYVAIKVLHERLAEEADFITRFQREARAVARLRHPHIIQVFDFDADGDCYWMVMDYIEGGRTVKELLRDLDAHNQRMSLGQVLEIATHVADALDYAHHQGMVHRDIKPSNILLRSPVDPVLGDFGIARLADQSGLTASGAMIGTPAYMSPEQGRGEKADERSDIYALGIVVYEMLTGRLPFDADTPFAIMLKHMNDPLISPRTLNEALPFSVERVVLKCLAKHPEDRYLTAGALRDALRAALDEVADATVRAVAAAPEPPPAQAAPAPPARPPADAVTLPMADTEPELLEMPVPPEPLFEPEAAEAPTLEAPAPQAVPTLAAAPATEGEAVTAPEIEPVRARPAARRRRPLLWVAGLVLALGAAAAIVFVNAPRREWLIPEDLGMKICRSSLAVPERCEVVELFDEPYVIDQPSWSPDGQRFAFQACRVENLWGGCTENTGLYISDREGNVTPVINRGRPDINVHWPVWSPDGERFAFHGFGELHTISLEGGQILSTLRSMPNNCPLGIAWSPDSTKIAWIGGRCEPGVPDIRNHVWTVNYPGSGGEIICQTGESQIQGGMIAWSPEGDAIAIQMEDGDVYLLPTDSGTAGCAVRAVGKPDEFPYDWLPNHRSIGLLDWLGR